MKTLYIECNMGAAGDMLMAALSELLPDPEGFIARMNALGLPGVRFERRHVEKCGVTGTQIHVTVDGEEEHSHDVAREQGEANGEQEQQHAHSHDHDHSHDHIHEHAHSHDHPLDHAHDDSSPAINHSQFSIFNSQLSSPSHPHDQTHDDSSPATIHSPFPIPHSPFPIPHSPFHHHASLQDICAIIDGLELPEPVRADARAVYGLIAEAESKVHGHPVEQIHFHEVGTLDAVADVVGVCALMHALAPERVLVSPVHVGCGQVRCAHGVLPVPAPATALLLEGVPVYGGRIRGELCTPTGAALLRHFADGFGEMPPMTLERVGYGMGSKDFEWANCVRALLGQTADAPDSAAELRCNLDDMTGEEIGFAVQCLRKAGALDVWTQAIQMKKDRPGTMLCCLCPPEREGEFARLMLRRYTLTREAVTLDTPYGPVRAKRSHGYGVARVKPEFDDLAEIAEREGLSVRDIPVVTD